MSDIKEDALKKGLAEIWAALSLCKYKDILETMETVSRAKAKCLALIDPELLCKSDEEILRHNSFQSRPYFAHSKDIERFACTVMGVKNRKELNGKTQKSPLSM